MVGGKILVVEDNPLNMKLVRSLLKLEKYEVIEAEDAEEGIRLASERLPDLILMDIQLPGMDGLAAVKKIKEDKRLSSIPVVALTSFAMQGDEEKALSAGCVGYITKPFHTNEFTPKIARYIGA